MRRYLAIALVSMGLHALATAAAPAGTRPAAATKPVRLELKCLAAGQFDALCGQFAWQRSPWKPGGDGGEGAKRFTFNGQILDKRPDCTWFDKLAPEALRRDALILPEDRDPVDVILRRTEALLKDIRRLGPRYDLGDAEGELRISRAEADRVPPQARLVTTKDKAGREATILQLDNKAERLAIFEKVFLLRRRIALANPLLNFDQLLYVNTTLGGHLCAQFYGQGRRSSGQPGLLVLQDPFGPNPAVRNLLADSVVASGRLKGETLAQGAFITPDVSFDGKTIVFAYSECKAKSEPLTYDTRKGLWDQNGTFHLFRANVDGSDLRQLTDGPFNDHGPCWLPSGRIAFASERRGGYARCSYWPSITATLYGIDADGGDMVPLSYHETNEMTPSVNHNGMIVYTRWDYIDRGDCIAHHPWITTPDGRDARAIHGNYPVDRGARPDMEMSVRAIPGSHKYVATAVGHHGAFNGSLVIIDPRVPDDGGMSPLKRLTPDCPFPETEGHAPGANAYCTAWPLSEDYHLATWGQAICLVDSFGNREPLGIGGTSPMPLRGRPKPPVLPHGTTVGRPAGVQEGPKGAKDQPAVVSCLNVYESRFPWPEGTKIRELRIVQIFPKTTMNMDQPRIGPASESLARGVLGTVPVEADGSAHFLIPPGKEVYFQALDEKGLAVQSMMSGAYFQPGEKATCVGCHEDRHRSPTRPASVPLAMRREPSKIKPEAEGSWPLTFPRLVQPALDRSCGECHKQYSSKTPDTRRPQDKSIFSPAYGHLTHGAFGRNGKPPNNPVVNNTPGEFGAMASKLYQRMQKCKGIKEGKVPADDIRRITLWLDTNCNFFGAYHDEAAQARGELVRPELE
jgi:cytochrome c553